MIAPSIAESRLALVTGAAGHLGSWVARELAAVGFRLRALDRRRPEPGLLPSDCEILVGDVRDAQVVATAARDVDAVFHLAMQHYSGREPESELQSVALDGLDAVVAAVRASSKRPRLVWTGSAGAIGETRDRSRPLDEGAWNTETVTPYTRAKTDAERRLWATARDLDAVAVLPTMTIGPRDPSGTASNARIEQLLRRARLPVWFAGGLNVVDVRDVAHGHLLAYERGRSGRRYLLGGTNLEFFELGLALRRLRGIGGEPSIRIPDRALLAAVGGYQVASRLLGRRAAVTTRQLAQRLGRYAWVSSERARTELGYAARPFEESVTELVRAWVTEGRVPRRWIPRAG